MFTVYLLNKACAKSFGQTKHLVCTSVADGPVKFIMYNTALASVSQAVSQSVSQSVSQANFSALVQRPASSPAVTSVTSITSITSITGKQQWARVARATAITGQG